MEPGQLLKLLREKTGLNQTEFAKVVEIDRTRISKYENEIDRISLEMFLTWCKKLEIEIEIKNRV